MGAAGRLLDRFGQTQFDRRVKYLDLVKASEAEGLVARAYEQMSREFGLVAEPHAVHSSNPELLAAAWCATRETLVAGKAARDIKETVARSVSEANSCSYCVGAHTMMLQAVGAGDSRSVELDRIAAWAKATRFKGAAELEDPPFSFDDAPSIIGTAITFHYVNRVVDVFLPDSPMPVRVPGMDGITKKVGAKVFSSVVKSEHRPGESLQLLPDAELPEDLAWASGDRFVSGAFARFSKEVSSAGEESLSETARTRVEEQVGKWSGEDMGLSRSWVDQAATGLEGQALDDARLALLVALAPHQVDEALVNDFRKRRPQDSQLIGAVSWAAFCAARRVGSWLKLPERSAAGIAE